MPKCVWPTRPLSREEQTAGAECIVRIVAVPARGAEAGLQLDVRVRGLGGWFGRTPTVEASAVLNRSKGRDFRLTDVATTQGHSSSSSDRTLAGMAAFFAVLPAW